MKTASRERADARRQALVVLLTLMAACCGIVPSACSHIARHDRFFGAAFIAYLGPFRPQFNARATVDVPTGSLQSSSPNVEFQIIESQTVVEGGLIRRRARARLTAFAADVVARRRVSYALGPVSDGPHVISIRGSEGVTKFLVDGKVMYTFKARLSMDRNSSVMIGAFVLRAGDQPLGSIWSVSVNANSRNRGPSCVLGSGGIRLERRGATWYLQGRYDPATPPVKVRCSS